MKKLHIFKYPYGHAANNPGCADGPGVLSHSSYLNEIKDHLDWQTPATTSDTQTQLAAQAAVTTLNLALADAVAACVKQNQKFVTVGGDHSSAIGTWRGASQAIAKKGELGLIWFDAHLDSHTFKTTTSQNIHGMPLAVLMNQGDTHFLNQFAAYRPLKPENIVIIGARSFEAGEHELLETLGVKIIYMNAIRRFGLKAAFEQALTIVTKETAGFGISIDLDGFDPHDAPGVGAPVSAGVLAADFLENSNAVFNHPQLLGIEIVEFNPHRDQAQKTEQLAATLIQKYA